MINYRKRIKSILPPIISAYARHQARQGFPILKCKSAIIGDFIRYVRDNRVIGDKGDSLIAIARAQANIIGKITLDTSSYYIYPFDRHLVRIPKGQELASLTPDYAHVLQMSLKEVKITLTGNSEFENGMSLLVKSIEVLGNNIKQQLLLGKSQREKELAELFPSLLYYPARTFDEALQKILFYNALLWQNRIWHNGLGRLDNILYPYYKSDLANGILTRKEAIKKLKAFILLLSKDSEYKSLSLIGDTGQVILLGGINKDGCNVANELTEIFLEIFAELNIPDPKLILRVNKQTPNEIWRLSTDCLITGCGSPLLMNEALIIPLMERFGYAANDCSELGTSSCWEPLIIGKSFDQNNPVGSIVPLSPLLEMLEDHYNTFDDFLSDYLIRLQKLVKKRTTVIKFDKSPVMSLLFDTCLKKKKDITEGGAVYYYHGMQVVGLPNTVNSLLNIKSFIFEKHILTLNECYRILQSNYKEREDIRILFLNNSMKFGCPSSEVVKLTNLVSNCISAAISNVTINGFPVKVGFSSPSYISNARTFPATPDGRKTKEPFATHISPISCDVDLAEILHFATELDYSGNRLNGNVVDFVIPGIFKNNPDKLVSLLKNAFYRGLYEIQLNVLNAEQLKDAKLHPDKYPYLIVRVWGFSAYFNDLPEEYKDNLIRRAEVYAS